MEHHDAQYCPIAQAAEVIAERWTPLILRELLLGTRRYSHFQRAIPLIPPNTLSRRLATLCDAGIVTKTAAPDDARGTEYHLTQAGDELRPIIIELGKWGGQMAEP